MADKHEASLNLIDISEMKKDDDTKTYIYVHPGSNLTAIFKTAIAEGCAYFFLILVILLTKKDPTKFIFGFWAIYMIFGNISGAHVNPIVSIALWIYNGNMLYSKNIIKTVLYILFQLFGGALAAMFVRFLTKNKKNFRLPHIAPGEGESVLDAMIVEIFFSGVLAFVALFVACSSTRPTNKNHVNLTLVAAVKYVFINAGVEVSGACYNPTVFFILNGYFYFTGEEGAFDYYYIYFTAPFIGSIIFTIFFKYLFKPYYLSKNRKVMSVEDD